MKFDGDGYLKYIFETEEEQQNFQLSLRIKTSDVEGTVMTTNASDWGTLQVLQHNTQRHTHLRDINTLCNITTGVFVGGTGLLSIVFTFFVPPLVVYLEE